MVNTLELKNAIKFAEENNIPVQYSEIDVRNIRGLNKHLGETETNKYFRTMADIISEETKKYSGKAMLFRHGADEVSIVSLGSPKAEMEKVLDNASLQIEKYVQDNNLSEIEHGKGGRKGTGIYTKTVDASGLYYKDVINKADLDLEKIKIANMPKPEEKQALLVKENKEGNLAKLEENDVKPIKKLIAKVNLYTIFRIITIMMLFGALFSQESWYYTILKFTVFCITGYGTYILYQSKLHQRWLWTFVVIGLLFNPFVPIQLDDYDLWNIIDIVVALILIVSIFRLKNKEQQ